MDFHLNTAVVTGFVRHMGNVQPGTGITHEARLFDMNDSLYHFDFNAHLTRKFNKKFKASLHYYHFVFNNVVNPVTLLAKGYITADIGVIDMQYRISRKHSIRWEVQGLITEKDRGNWGAALVECTISPKWFFSVQDQYNFGHPDPALRIHYPLFAFGYIRNTARFTISYGRQRAGIVCIGGVCRLVPATNGLSFSMTTTL